MIKVLLVSSETKKTTYTNMKLSNKIQELKLQLIEEKKQNRLLTEKLDEMERSIDLQKIQLNVAKKFICEVQNTLYSPDEIENINFKASEILRKIDS